MGEYAELALAQEQSNWMEPPFESRSHKLTWTTQDGKELLLTEMTDSHLQNTINMLERKGLSHVSTQLVAELSNR